MANIIITGGPTDEAIDEVMKITNMSSGKISVTLAKKFIEDGHNVTLIGNKGIYNRVFGEERYSAAFLEEEYPHKFVFMHINSTQDMYEALENVSYLENKLHETLGTPLTDMVIHAAAVGDYKPEFSFLMEDMAKEIHTKLIGHRINSEYLYNIIYNTLTNPDCKLDSNTKISSYQNNLTVKLGLTPKIIANLRGWFPTARLVGFKLLDNVPVDELTEVAYKLCCKNELDYVIANDLSLLRKGDRTSHFVAQITVDGKSYSSPLKMKYIRTVESTDEIYQGLTKILKDELV